MSAQLLSVENLKVSFGRELNAICGISFNVYEGETLGIVGESGCGKSLTSLALMGLLPENATYSADRIDLLGTDLKRLKENEWRKIRGPKISMIFQDPMSALNPMFSVGLQITETLHAHQSLTKKEATKKAIALLGQVGIPAPEQRLKAYGHELSGGMAQRVMIAMAISCGPKLLIADEPTTALDVTIQKQILDLLRNLQQEEKMGMILITHDLGVVANYSDRIQVMYAGEVAESAPAQELMKNPMHPYTQGLLQGLPENRKPKEKLFAIKGLVPTLNARPTGCQFSPRCPQAFGDCQVQRPKPIKSQGREVSCLLKTEGVARA